MLAAGGIAVLIDEDNDAADLVSAGKGVTAQTINFFAREARGLICLALAPEQVDRLQLRPMAIGWQQPSKPFTVSIDARAGITTGISAEERAHTIRTAVRPDIGPDDLVVPGHVFPLRAPMAASAAGGAPVSRTEAALRLVQLAGQGAGAAICELLDQEGDLGDAAWARRFARQHGLPWTCLRALTARTPRPGQGPGRSRDDGRGARDLWCEALALAAPLPRLSDRF